MTAIFRRFDVDYEQWKAVSRTLLRTDFRLPLADGASRLGRVGGLLTMTVFLSLFGAGAAIVVFINPDVLLTGTISLAYLSVMLATTLLTQHGLTLLSTTDYAILAPRPVSSRTFLAIRVTNVLFHALLITTLTGYPVVVAYVVAHGVNLPRGMAATAAIYGWSISLTLTLVAAYGTLLRAFGAAGLRRALGYLQLVVGFMVYGGLLLASRLLVGSQFASATAPDAWWMALVPPAWFASYIELAVGSPNSTTMLRVLLSITALVVLTLVLHGRLGLEYARHLSDTLVNDDPAASGSIRTPFFREGEARAAAILVMAHFRHDLRVRLGILAIVPLIALYLLLGARGEGVDLVALAVLLFPALLTRHFASSDAHQASWMFHVTPAEHARLIIAVKNIAFVYFLLPFLVLVAAVFAWRAGDLVHGIVHTAMLGLVSNIAMQGAIIIAPRLPFALPPDKATGSASLMAWMMVVIFGGQGAVVALDRWVYGSGVRVSVTLVALIVVTWMLNRAIGWRVARRRR